MEKNGAGSQNLVNLGQLCAEMSKIPDHYLTIATTASGEFKDRGSKFIALAFPVESEEECLAQIEILRKQHFKANHHCFAWRLGKDGTRFRASDDGEPSGTAGRPILNQIDAANLTNIMVVVVRYFGGTLLGTSGLINAYREATAEVLRQVQVIEKIDADVFHLQFDYALQPDVMHNLKKLNIKILGEDYAEKAVLEIAIRQSAAEETLLKFKSNLLKISKEEALTRDFPESFFIKKIGETCA